MVNSYQFKNVISLFSRKILIPGICLFALVIPVNMKASTVKPKVITDVCQLYVNMSSGAWFMVCPTQHIDILQIKYLLEIGHQPDQLICQAEHNLVLTMVLLLMIHVEVMIAI